MRNPNGYGSVYKLSGKRRAKYGVKKVTGWNEKGQPVYAYLGYYTTRKEAMLALGEYNSDPYDIKAREATFADIYSVFLNRLLARLELGKVSNSAVGNYKSAYKHLGGLYTVKMVDIKTYRIQDIINKLELGYQSKQHIRSLIKQVFDIAIEMDICEKNYTKFLLLEDKNLSTKHKAFTVEEIRLIEGNLDKRPNTDIAVMLIYTGMRPNELFKLRKEDIHLEERYLVAGSKTKAGRNRVIPIHKKLIPIIKARLDNDTEYLIDYNGGILKVGTYRETVWTNTVEKLGLDSLPYDCRHTFASLMNTAKANMLAIKRIMGHTTGDLTTDVYTHKHLSELIENIDLLD